MPELWLVCVALLAVAGLRGSLRVLSSLGRFLPCLCVTVCVGLDLRVPCCSSEFRKAGLICAHASVAKGTLRSGVCGLVGWLRVLCAGGLPGCAQAPGWPGAFWAPSRFGAYLRLWRHVPNKKYYKAQGPAKRNRKSVKSEAPNTH